MGRPCALRAILHRCGAFVASCALISTHGRARNGAFSFRSFPLAISFSFAQFERSFIARLILAGLFCVSLSAAALAKKDRWPVCRDGVAEARIAACTEILARGSKQTKRNQIAAYINRSSAYQPPVISTAPSPTSTRHCGSTQSHLPRRLRRPQRERQLHLVGAFVRNPALHASRFHLRQYKLIGLALQKWRAIPYERCLASPYSPTCS